MRGVGLDFLQSASKYSVCYYYWGQVQYDAQAFYMISSCQKSMRFKILTIKKAPLHSVKENYVYTKVASTGFIVTQTKRIWSEIV